MMKSRGLNALTVARWARVTVLLAVLAFLPRSTRADALVTGANCTHAGLQAALGIGGRITLACDGAIVLTNTLFVERDSDLDAFGHQLTLTGVTGTNATNGARLFEVLPGVRFTLANVTLTGGRSTNSGAAIYNDRGFVGLLLCVISNNLAAGSNGLAGGRGSDSQFQNGGRGRNGSNGRPAFGGAIFNRLGTTIVDRCLFITNSVIGGNGGSGGNGGDGSALGGNGGGGGAGARGLGGAIFNTGLLVVSNSTFHLNSAAGGSGGSGGTNGAGAAGGFAGHGGAGAGASGGALYNTNRGRVILYGSTFSLNSVRGGDSADAGSEVPRARAGKIGAGAFGGAICNLGTNIAVNCTFFANRIVAGSGGDGAISDVKGGRGGDGGPAWGGQIYSGMRTVLTNCTLFSGGATGGTNGAGGGAAAPGNPGRRGTSRGGNLANGNGVFLLKNCLIADAFIGTNGYGAFTDAGYNFSTDRSMRLRGPGSRTNAAAVLDVLRNNGGRTQTIALLEGSPAIDTADPFISLPFDQRGVTRPYGSRSDIGAYEFGLTLLPPVITTQPLSQTTQVGGAATFLAVASGDPPLTYQWRRGGTAIAGATSPMLTLSNVQTNDGANYDVVVANNSGSVTSSVATLSLVTPVGITQQPVSLTVTEGATAVFSVTATGAGTLNYRWFFNGTAIPGAVLPTLTIVNAQTNHAGDYQVLVFNSFSSVASAVAVLTVGNNPPEILAQPEDVRVDSGLTAEFIVVADGTQPLRYQWYRNSTEAVAGGTNATLTISNAQPAHRGGYTVVITNALGSITSTEATLEVIEVAPEIFFQTDGPLEPCFNDSVSLSVTARGTEPLTFQWFQDDVPLAGATNGTYTIVAVATNHAGSYHVVVSNAFGTDTHLVEILVTPDPKITTQPVDQTVSAGTAAEFSVDHCLSPGPFSYQWFLNGADITGATSRVYRITSVSPTNAGTYHVVVSNAFGTVESGMADLSVLVPFTKDDCETIDDQLFCTITVAALPGVVYSLEFSFDGGGLWQPSDSRELPDETPGELELLYDGPADNGEPEFRVIVHPL